jgi:hypothetical protein
VTSFEFTVYVSANVQFPNGYVDVTGASPFLLQSGTQSLGATTRTATGNPLTGATVTFASSAPAVATVDATSGVVTGVAPGTATITATSSASTTGTVTVQVCPNLAIGESYATSGSDASNICLGGMGSTTEYTVIPTNSSTSSAVSLTLTGSNIQAVTGPPSPTVIPSGGLRLSAAASDAGVTTRAANAADGDVFGAVAASENAQVSRWSGSGRATDLVREVMAQTVGGPYVPDDSYVEPDVSDGSAPQALLADGVAPASGGRERLMWYPPSNSDVALTRPESGADDRLANDAGGSASDGIAVKTMLPTPAVGDTVQYNTTNACSGSASVRTGVVRSVSTHALVVADTANPAGGFTTSQYDSIGLEFDTIAYQVDAANFGTPTDVDGNGHVVLFFTRAVNELSPPVSSIVTLGTFAQKDVFTNAECSNGNAAEMLYLLVPDPTGAVNSNVRTVSFVRGNVIGTAGHEMAKMIDAFGRHQRSAPFESGWLDESLGAFAEELMFYRTSVGLTPKQNLIVANVNTGPNASRRVAAFNTYANQNLTRLRSWLQRPDTAGIAGSTSLARTGFGWAFLRYASDRKGAGDAAFLQSLLTSSDTGMANIQGAIGGSAPSDWIRDFVSALYADDNAFSVAAPLQFPSWNLRSFFAILNGSYQLAPRVLTNNTPLTLSYGKGNGASVYGRVGVAASTFATITLSSAGSTPPPTVQLTVIRTK